MSPSGQGVTSPNINSADQTQIQGAISALSTQALRWTGRGPQGEDTPTQSPFCKPITYTETYNGNGSWQLLLRNAPIQSVASLTIGNCVIPQSTQWGQPGWVIDGEKRFLDIRGQAGGQSAPYTTVGFPIGWQAYGFWKGQQNVLVTYAAGYTTVPGDIFFAAIRTCALRWKGKDWIGQKSKSMGDFGSVVYVEGDILDTDYRVFMSYARMGY